MKLPQSLFVISALLLMVLPAAADQPAIAVQPVAQDSARHGNRSRTITGVIEYNTLEGGAYVIVNGHGKTFIPVNLPAEFEHIGLQVRARVRVLNRYSIYQYGSLVFVKHISAQ